MPRAAGSWLDPWVFSSVWVAAAAAALATASGPALGAWPAPAVPALAFCGTLVVYNLDRLRDLERDRATAPARSAFVERHRGALVALVIVAAGAAGLLALWLGPRALALLAPVLLAGLFHRRLKRFAGWKPFYLSVAWLLVVVGLPAVSMQAPRHLGWVLVVVGTTVVANVIASNLRDGEAVTERFGAAVPLRLARGCALAGCGAAALAPVPVRPLVCVPLATLAALVGYRREERYGLVVVDGALIAGALLALPGWMLL